MWNETDHPIAYLITFRCYGTWLHGDERTSVDRDHNIYRGSRYPARENRQSYAKSIMRGDPVYLDAKRRRAVSEAINEVCEHREIKLYALNVRTNHVHIVISAGTRKPGWAMNAFKAYSTRKMREKGIWAFDHSPWVDKGSERWLWTDKHLGNACDYVLNGQGADLQDYDNWERQ